MDKTTEKYTEGYNNKALEVLAEQTTLGHTDIEGERKSRKHTGGAFRNPLKAFGDLITGKHEQAIREIRIGHLSQVGQLNYRDMYQTIDGGYGGSGLEDFMAEKSQADINYADWLRQGNQRMPVAVGLCIDIFARSLSIKQASLNAQVSDKTAKRRAMLALDFYVILNKL